MILAIFLPLSRLSNVSTCVTTLKYNKKHTTKNICHDIECNIRHLFRKFFKCWRMLQIVQNGEKFKKPKNGDFQHKITKCAPFWAQKWGFSEKCRKSPETLRNAIIFQNIICCIMSQSMSRHLSCFLLYVVCLVLLRFWTVNHFPPIFKALWYVSCVVLYYTSNTLSSSC